MQTHSRIVMVLLALALVTALAPVGAEDAGDPYWRDGNGEPKNPEAGQCPSWTSYVPPDAEETSFVVYVANDGFWGPWLFPALWIYQESNGMQGLQRYDGYCTNEGAENVDAYREIHDAVIW